MTGAASGAAAHSPLDFGDPVQLSEVRARLRAWLAENPVPPRLPDEQVPSHLHRWHRLLHSGGWVGLDVPKRYGGGGLTTQHQVAAVSYTHLTLPTTERV